jgi:hypothetical protein
LSSNKAYNSHNDEWTIVVQSKVFPDIVKLQSVSSRHFEGTVEGCKDGAVDTVGFKVGNVLGEDEKEVEGSILGTLVTIGEGDGTVDGTDERESR